MRNIAILFILLILSKVGSSQTICEGLQVVPVETFNQCNDNPWNLIFQDDFDGDSLDMSIWKYGPRIRYCNNEQQYYTSGDNIKVSNGIIKLITLRDTLYARAVDWKPDEEILFCNDRNRGQNARVFYYTSGNIETVEKYHFGKIEARVKIPKGRGLWPAFWTFGGAPWNEIDIFEFWNENNIWGNYDPSKLAKVHHMNAWYDFDFDNNGDGCSTNYLGVDFSENFHVFTVIWEKNKIEWFVDGDLKRTDYRYYTILGQTTGCTINAWSQYKMNRTYPIDPMRIIFNVAVQSGTNKRGDENSPDNTTPFPSQMEVDWVKYYAREEPESTIASNTFSDVHPNPNNGVFTVDVDCDLTDEIVIEILTLNYQVIFDKNLISTSTSIDLKYLENGIYILKATNNKTSHIDFHKLIISK